MKIYLAMRDYSIDGYHRSVYVMEIFNSEDKAKDFIEHHIETAYRVPKSFIYEEKNNKWIEDDFDEDIYYIEEREVK